MASSAFNVLLVPLDGSPQAAAALPAARTLALATHSSIALLRIVPPAHPTSEQRELAEASQNLARVAQELGTVGIEVTHTVHVGDPGAEILATARDIGAGLIVMATHGRSGLARAVLGSVSAGVLAQTVVPLLLLRPGGKRLTRVQRLLVPVDGTPGSAMALSAALPLARATGARVHLLEVVLPMPVWALASQTFVSANYDPAWDDAASQRAETYTSGLAARLQRSNIQADGRVLQGEPGATIVHAAQDLNVDLVVMSTHAHTGPLRALLGSVADEVVRGAGRPVLLVRQARPEPTPREPDTSTDVPLFAT